MNKRILTILLMFPILAGPALMSGITRDEVEYVIRYSASEAFFNDRIPTKEAIIERFKLKYKLSDDDLVRLVEDYLHFWPEDEPLTRDTLHAVLGTWGRIGTPRARENIAAFMKGYEDEDPVEKLKLRTSALLAYVLKYDKPLDDFLIWVLEDLDGPYDYSLRLVIYRHWRSLSESTPKLDLFEQAIPKIMSAYRSVSEYSGWLILDQTLENLGLTRESDVIEIRKRRVAEFLAMDGLTPRMISRLQAVKDKVEAERDE